MAKVVVVGAGVMGLAAAYQAMKDGHSVTVVEAAPEAGGMASHFDLEGVSIEKFYHFICKTDFPTFDLVEELGIAGTLRWVPTTMGFYSDGTLSKWGEPLSLLRFKGLSLLEKARYGLFAFVCVRRNTWGAIEGETAHHWIHRWCGESVYNKLWRSLFQYKFYEYAESISALWIWTRIRRIGRSRKNLMQEELGYLEGGSETLVDGLMGALQRGGATVELGAAARRVTAEADGHGGGKRVTGVETERGTFAADFVISTVPTPYVSAMVPDLPADWKAKFEAIRNIGVICVIFKLRRSVSPHFWVNVADGGHGIPGVIEFSNLRKVEGGSVVYVPYYMPTSNEKFVWPDQALLAEAFACLQQLNPALTGDDILGDEGGATAIRPADLRTGLCGEDSAGANTHRGPADCRYVLLLPRRPGYCGKYSTRTKHGVDAGGGGISALVAPVPDRAGCGPGWKFRGKQ